MRGGRRGVGTAGTPARVRRRDARPAVDDAQVDRRRDQHRPRSAPAGPTATRERVSTTFAITRSSRPGSASPGAASRGRRRDSAGTVAEAAQGGRDDLLERDGAHVRRRAHRSGAGSCRGGCRPGVSRSVSASIVRGTASGASGLQVTSCCEQAGHRRLDRRPAGCGGRARPRRGARYGARSPARERPLAAGRRLQQARRSWSAKAREHVLVEHIELPSGEHEPPVAALVQV